MRAVVIVGAMLTLAAVASVGAFETQRPPAPVKVFCFVEENASGFIDQKVQALRDSLKDVKDSIGKKKDWMKLVDSRDDADIVVQVVSRTIDGSGRVESTASSYTDDKGRTSRATGSTREIMNYNLAAVMRVGDYTNELTGSVPDTYILGGPWRTAANQVAGELEKWVKDNYSRLTLKK